MIDYGKLYEFEAPAEGSLTLARTQAEVIPANLRQAMKPVKEEPHLATDSPKLAKQKKQNKN